MSARVVAILDRFVEAVAANHKERVLAPVMARLQRHLARAFREQGRRLLRGLGTLRSRFTESAALRESLTSDDWLRLFDEATGATTELFFGAIQDAARAAMLLGAQNAIADVGIDSAFTLRNPRAEAYLQAHGYGLISQIDSVTRGNIATIIDEAMRTGQGYNETAREISRLYSEMAVGRPQQHIESRAHLIAVNETGMAYEAGNAIVGRDLQDAGLRMEKKWLTVGDDRVSAGCRANEAEGWIPLERAHRSGHQQPLRFPGCRCTELYQRARTATSAPVEFEPAVGAPPAQQQQQQQQLQYNPTPRQLERVNETIDEQLQRLAQNFQTTPAEIERVVDEAFRDLVTGRDLAIQFKSRNLDTFLTDGRFKTQFETNSSGGALDQSYRARAENTGLGAPLDLDPRQRPIYGYVNLGTAAQQQVSQYGDITFLLKDEVRPRTTVTMDDSLFNFATDRVAGTPINAPTRASWDEHVLTLYEYSQHRDPNRVVNDVSYIEIQIQGGVSLADVKSVIDRGSRLTTEQRQTLEGMGISIWH